MTTDRTQLASNSDDLATLIAQAEVEAEVAAVSEESRVGTVIQKPTPDAPIASRINSVTGAGWVTVYHVRTGDESRINRNMLSAQLQKIDPETGQRAWTTVDPGFRPRNGTLKCWLHPDYELEEEMAKFGFSTCLKANLISPYEVNEHVRRKHPREHASILNERERKRRDDDAARQDRLIEAVLAGRAAPEQAQAEIAPAPEPVPEAETNQSGVGVSKPCPICSEMLDARNQGGWNLKLRSHKKRQHPED